jgi:hypothetical protein
MVSRGLLVSPVCDSERCLPNNASKPSLSRMTRQAMNKVPLDSVDSVDTVINRSASFGKG